MKNKPSTAAARHARGPTRPRRLGLVLVVALVLFLVRPLVAANAVTIRVTILRRGAVMVMSQRQCVLVAAQTILIEQTSRARQGELNRFGG